MPCPTVHDRSIPHTVAPCVMTAEITASHIYHAAMLQRHSAQNPHAVSFAGTLNLNIMASSAKPAQGFSVLMAVASPRATASPSMHTAHMSRPEILRDGTVNRSSTRPVDRLANRTPCPKGAHPVPQRGTYGRGLETAPYASLRGTSSRPQ